ncbi:hypothetical protein GCM10027089_63880 [Nocardia thraciensis]
MIQVITLGPTCQSDCMAENMGIGTYIWPVASRADSTKTGSVRPVWARGNAPAEGETTWSVTIVGAMATTVSAFRQGVNRIVGWRLVKFSP